MKILKGRFEKHPFIFVVTSFLVEPILVADFLENLIVLSK